MGVNVTPHLVEDNGEHGGDLTQALTQRSISPPRTQLGEVGHNVDSRIIMNKRPMFLQLVIVLAIPIICFTSKEASKSGKFTLLLHKDLRRKSTN